MPSSVIIKDAIMKRVVHKKQKEGLYGVDYNVILFALENMLDKRSYIKFYVFNDTSQSEGILEKKAMFYDSIRQLVEIDSNPEKGLVAILFEKPSSGFALVRTNY